MPPSPPAYARSLGLFSGTMAVVGGIVGSGIFVNPQIVAQRVGTAGLTLGAWVAGGAVALAGAFCFGELAWRRPRAGGGYVYIREAFGPLPAFLYGWALLLVIATGAIAAVAFTFASYAASLAGLREGWITPTAAGSIALLTLVNYAGVKPGAFIQNAFTVLKLGALATLIVAGLAATGRPEPAPPAPAGDAPLAFAAALVPVLFAYGGWQQTNFIAEEIVDPARTLPRALVLGVLIVVAVYLLANLTYLRALGPAGLAASRAPAADAMRLALGEAGAKLIAAGIAASSFGFLGLVILVSPRVYQAMAADGLFLPALARLHPRYRTPGAALLVQGGLAIGLLLSGTYGQLLDYVVFCDWIFFGMAVLALFVLRRRDRAGGEPEPPAGIRVPGYPLTPALFVAAAGYVVAGSISSNPGNALLGTGILAAGVPVFWYWKRRAVQGDRVK
ncbi:MAG TPA: amino acid permease [Gemmatimonadales bacterium]|jgi:APA family basic amino acid/polyamine antiporter|nr:amino acid permease [Gemmatimonadales bacterium]